MANYLPVLLVSVNTNSIPDDNALTTMPCGQVDYLSHDWLEEDVWRSWRNMTRQKNEITNGLRLENASWRTWWKQRNKLKTVSPETLNWLKDSDVTWLYGPLHTAVDWSPPPKPAPVPDSVDSGNPASTQDRLDLHSVPSPSSRHPQHPPTKPILKHRSISELLTSDLPVSPVFSPQESEDESTFTHISPSSDTHKRPCLPHTKSDTHITRWGQSRAFRKDSPPRIVSSRSSDRSPSHQSTVRASGAVRSSLSQDSTSSASASGSTERTTKKKHISFNTFVEQCIAIDKHPRKGLRRKPALGFGDYVDNDYDYDEEQEGGDKDSKWEDDDGYEEDREDNLFDDDDPLWLAAQGGVRPRRRHLNGSAIHSDSDSDDDAIEIRPSSYRQSNLVPSHSKKKSPRSTSVSSSSSTTTTTTSSASSSTHPRQRRNSASAGPTVPRLLSPPSASAYRPRPSYPTQTDHPYRDHVTIAPIAPTFLKTTGAWEEGFGDEGGVSDDGLWDFGVPRHGVNNRPGDGNGKGKKDIGGRYDQDEGSYGTPVELVYVPPFGSTYGYDAATRRRRDHEGLVEDEDEDETDRAEDAKSQDTILKQGEAITQNSSVAEAEQDILVPSPIPIEHSAPISTRTSVPVVVIDSSADSDSTPSETPGWTNSNTGSTTTTPVPVPSKNLQLQQEDERGRERGRSLSISPVGGSGNNSRTVPAPSSSSSGAPLTSRGRSQSSQDLQSLHSTSIPTTSIQGGAQRGRSGMRGPSNPGNGSSSGPVRGRSHSGGRSGGSASPNVHLSASPIGGSLSPDGSDTRLGGIGNAYAGGRIGGRERERIEKVSSSSSLSSKVPSVASDDRRGRDRGRRDIGSSSGSSSTGSPEERRQRGRSGRCLHESESLSPQGVIDAETRSPSPSVTADIGDGEGKGKFKELILQVKTGISGSTTVPQRMEMDASICSVSSEGSTATIVPTSNEVSPTLKGPEALDLDVISPTDGEPRVEREAIEEAESWRKLVPTPSNSSMITITAPRTAQATLTSPTRPLTAASVPSEHSPGHIRTASSSSTYSPNTPSNFKLKSPPPIIPSPSQPSPASTSSSYAPGEVSPTIILTGFYGRSASRSLERASSGSRERHSASSVSSPTNPSSALRKEITPDMTQERELAEARRGRGNLPSSVNANWDVDADMRMREPTSPVIDGHREKETIIDKAVGMVSSAGAYLRLWPNQGIAQ